VETSDPTDILYQLVNLQVTPESSLDQICQQVQAAGVAASIPEDVVGQVVARFESERGTAAVATPRLLVDWGEPPRVGHQVRPEFNLLCPGYEDSRPEVRVSIDRELDHDEVSLRPVQIEDPGLWSCQVPFRMTSDGMDCRPGQYVIEVDLSFRDVPAGMPRFYRCRIRLNVKDAAAEEGGVLEIDGDGQSIVNLQGYNLKQFSKVILKGGEGSVINLQDAMGAPDDSAEALSEKPATTFEYELKVDTEKQQRLPAVQPTAAKRAYLDACGFFFEDGRRTLVMTGQRITFGRSRDNDVIIRFLPRSDENDNYSRNISRTHCIAELTSEGIELRDKSNRGMEVNYRVVQDREMISAVFAGDVVHVELGVTATVSQKFEMELALFEPDRRTSRDELEYWDEMFCEVIEGRLSRLHRNALDVGLDAARYDRVTNLPGKESYVHLFREVLIGGSPAKSAIVLHECGPQVQARLLYLDRTFWLEPLTGGLPVTVDNVVTPPRTLVPLTPGMELQFGSEKVRFDRPSQLYLD
jgi:hypothetical protein